MKFSKSLSRDWHAIKNVENNATLSILSKHKDVATTLSQGPTICCIDNVSLLEIKVLLTPLRKAEARLKSDVVVTLRARCANFGRMLQNCNFT